MWAVRPLAEKRDIDDARRVATLDENGGRRNQSPRGWPNRGHRDYSTRRPSLGVVGVPFARATMALRPWLRLRRLRLILVALGMAPLRRLLSRLGRTPALRLELFRTGHLPVSCLTVLTPLRARLSLSLVLR